MRLFPLGIGLMGGCLLGGTPLPLAAVGEASRQDQQEHARGDAATSGVHQQQRKAVGAYPVPVVETQADIARGHDGAATVLCNPQLSSPEQRRERLTASVDLHPILTLGERNGHGVWGPPNVASLREFTVERDRSDKEERHAEGRKNEPDARGHRGPPCW